MKALKTEREATKRSNYNYSFWARIAAASIVCLASGHSLLLQTTSSFVSLSSPSWTEEVLLARKSHGNMSHISRDEDMDNVVVVITPTNTTIVAASAAASLRATKVTQASNDGEVSLASAIDYVRSFEKNFRQSLSNQRPLTFIHVPKTGGTSIEAVAKKHNISWGFCMYPSPTKKYAHCEGPPPFALNGTWTAGVPWWHVPRQYYPLANVDPFHGESFVAIRDPLQRMVSEFYYKCGPKLKQCDMKRIFEPEYMNYWISKMMKKHGHKVNDHFAPQYLFAVGPNQVRMADHVLRFDSLNGDFKRLMKAYSLEQLQLEEADNSGQSFLDKNPKTAKQTKLDVNHLSADTLQQILSMHPDDFSAFGYQYNRTAVQVQRI